MELRMGAWCQSVLLMEPYFEDTQTFRNAYTGGFIPQAAFGIHVLRDTTYAVAPQSIENLRNLILTYRLYCQKYAMPFDLRRRHPHQPQGTQECFLRR